ncbi:MAG: response regulator transcription factor [Solirubrobacteraceae bacterium]
MGDAPIRVVVADDQNAVRQGLVALLGTMDGVQVVGEAADGRDAVRLALLKHADVVLMDVRMPATDGIAATRLLAERRPAVAVLVLTTYDDEGTVFAALRAGARAVLTKSATAPEIRDAITAVHLGHDGEPGRTLPRVLRAGPGDGRPPPAPGGLTPRELEVLELIAAGCSNAEIATRLVVTQATVKTHVNNIFAKLDLRDRAQAVAWAFTHGVSGASPRPAGSGQAPPAGAGAPSVKQRG